MEEVTDEVSFFSTPGAAAISDATTATDEYDDDSEEGPVLNHAELKTADAADAANAAERQKTQLAILQHTLQLQYDLHREQMASVGRDAALKLTAAVAAAEARGESARERQRQRHEQEKQQTARSLRTYRAMVLEREARLAHALEESKCACTDLANLLLEQVEENKDLLQRVADAEAAAVANANANAADALRQREQAAARETEERQALMEAWEHDKQRALTELQRRCEQQMNERIAEMKQRYEDQARQQVAEARRRLEDRADDELQEVARRHEEELRRASRRHEKVASESATRLLHEQLALQQGMRREAEATIQKAMHSVALSCQGEKEAALRTLRDAMKARHAADREAAAEAHREALQALRDAHASELRHVQDTMAAITRDLRAAVPLAQERFHMQMADAEAAAVREAHHRMEQQQLFQFMTKTMQSLSAGTVERDGRIDAMQRTVQSLEQALALAVGEAARAETERSAGAAALATATSEVHSLSSDLDAARAAAAAAASALADARTVAEQATAALAAAERERDALFRALDAANQGAATAADMMRYVEERDAQAARDRAAVEAAHTQALALRQEAHRVELEAERAASGRLRDQLTALVAGHAEEVADLQRQHGQVLRALKDDQEATVELLREQIQGARESSHPPSPATHAPVHPPLPFKSAIHRVHAVSPLTVTFAPTPTDDCPRPQPRPSSWSVVSPGSVSPSIRTEQRPPYDLDDPYDQKSSRLSGIF